MGGGAGGNGQEDWWTHLPVFQGVGVARVDGGPLRQRSDCVRHKRVGVESPLTEGGTPLPAVRGRSA